MANKSKNGLGSLRYVQIDKDNSAIVIAVAAAAACLIFSLVAAQSLWKQASYNRRVISKKEQTRDTLETNIANLANLEDSYKTFVSTPTNIIDGSSSGSGDRDGDNAKIILDSLPSVYDFPGMLTGFNKVLNTGEFGQVKINAEDDEVSQKNNKTPTLVEIPLNMSAQGSLDATQAFLKRLDNSIRPVKVNTVNFAGDSSGQLVITIDGNTFYQPKKQFEVKTEVVK
jgi:hypothetical protein